MKTIQKFERFLIAGIVLGFAALLLVQTMMAIDHQWLVAGLSEELEKRPVNFYQEYPEARVTSGPYQTVFATITIQCENFSSLEKAILLVNGEEVGDFRDKQLTIKVSPGDTVSIDGSFYTHELIFKVVAASENVGQPEIGQIIRVNGDVALVGEVRMK